MTGNRGRSRKQHTPNRAPMDSAPPSTQKAQEPTKKRKRKAIKSDSSKSPPTSPDTPMLNNQAPAEGYLHTPAAIHDLPFDHMAAAALITPPSSPNTAQKNNAQLTVDGTATAVAAAAAAAAAVALSQRTRATVKHKTSLLAAAAAAAAAAGSSDDSALNSTGRGKQGPKKGKGQPRPLKPGLCNFCNETWSPMWRKGPPLLFPKLCNACGMRFSRQGMNAFEEKHRKPKFPVDEQLFPSNGPELHTDSQAPLLLRKSSDSAAGRQAAEGNTAAAGVAYEGQGALRVGSPSVASALVMSAAAGAAADTAADDGNNRGGGSKRTRRVTPKAAAMQLESLLATGRGRGQGRKRTAEEAAEQPAADDDGEEEELEAHPADRAALRDLMAAALGACEEGFDKPGTEEEGSLDNGGLDNYGSVFKPRRRSRLARTTYAEKMDMRPAGAATGLDMLLEAAAAHMDSEDAYKHKSVCDNECDEMAVDSGDGADMTDDSSGHGGLAAAINGDTANLLAHAQAATRAAASSAAALCRTGPGDAAPSSVPGPALAQQQQQHAWTVMGFNQAGAGGAAGAGAAMVAAAPAGVSGSAFQQVQQRLADPAEQAELLNMMLRNPALAQPMGLLMQGQLSDLLRNHGAALNLPAVSMPPVSLMAPNPSSLASIAGALSMVAPSMPAAAALYAQPMLLQQQLLPAQLTLPVTAVALTPSQMLQLLPSQLVPQLQRHNSAVTSIESDGTTGGKDNQAMAING